MGYSMIGTGARLREERKLRNLTQMDIADAIGVTNDTISAWENGRKNPKANLLFAYVDYLAKNSTEDNKPLSIDDIMGFRPERRVICGHVIDVSAEEAALLDLVEDEYGTKELV